MTGARGKSTGDTAASDSSGDALSQAEAAFGSGDLAACEAACRALLRDHPTHPRALLMLGSCLGRQGRPGEALDPLQAAAQVEPGNPDAHYTLGMCLTALGRSKEAEAAYRRVLGLVPGHAYAYNNLGVVLRESAQLPLAIACFREALAIEPGFRDALGNLARALLEAERPADALPLVEAFRDTALGLLHAQILRRLGRNDEAVALLGEMARRNPGQAEVRYALGQAQKDAGSHEAAIQTFTGAPLSGPAKARFESAAGVALMELGRLEEAKDAFQRAVAADPGHARAWLQLSGLKDFTASDPDIAAMERALEPPDLPERARTQITFALARALDRAGDHDRAFAWYQAGNAAVWARQGSEIDAVRATHAALRRRFRTITEEPSHDAAPGAAPRPIFIVGMPRSGTTLVEQILASHPEVQGAGELRLLHEATLEVVQPYPDGLAALGAEGLAAIAQRYRAGLAKLAPGVPYATDKMPVNYEKLGLIAEAFPGAPIVHVRRNPLDTCLSCYVTHFTKGQKFSYDLEELGRYYRLYEDLMAHWRAVLPTGRLLDLDYEELVAEPEAQVRRLLDHCGLDWSDACLQFHETERTVLTASAVQVRRPLNSSSIGRWRRFEQHLQPLIAALEA